MRPSRPARIALASGLALVAIAPDARAGTDLGVRWVDCVVEPALDRDRDGVDDACEESVVRGFEPELVFGLEETKPARVPYWAARRDGLETLRLFYALSYVQDAGDPTLGGASAHDGDSEFVVLRVQYDGSGVWSLVEGYLSAHYQTFCDTAEWLPAASFQWESEVGGRPLVFVAEGKHANYADLDACDAGGCLQDHCTDTTREPVGIVAVRDLGLKTTPLVDEVVLGGHREWYWTDEIFCGWLRPDGDDRSGCVPADNSYALQLADFDMDDGPASGLAFCEMCVDDVQCADGGRCFEGRCSRACEGGGCPNGAHCEIDPGFGSGQCQPDTTCECLAACSGRECGDPGCGALCGECGAGEECSSSGQCVPSVPACVARCEGKQCGDDGCGSPCGSCGDAERCEGGACVEMPGDATSGGNGGGDGEGVATDGCSCRGAAGAPEESTPWAVWLSALVLARVARRRGGRTAA